MNLNFTPNAWDDYLWWQSNDKKTLKRINNLLKEILRDPHHGIGKPEPLKENLSGYWSRRITGEHRIVYKVDEAIITVIQCRNHY
ncbi:MAG: Txe/YoeB family addiction module toxin [Cyclobacteriaceae bacterium]